MAYSQMCLATPWYYKPAAEAARSTMGQQWVNRGLWSVDFRTSFGPVPLGAANQYPLENPPDGFSLLNSWIAALVLNVSSTWMVVDTAYPAALIGGGGSKASEVLEEMWKKESGTKTPNVAELSLASFTCPAWKVKQKFKLRDLWLEKNFRSRPCMAFCWC